MAAADIIDLVAIAAVGALTALGVWRGLLKTVAGIAILIVALLGANWISGHFTEPVTERILPLVEDYLNSRLGQAAEDLAAETAENAVQNAEASARAAAEQSEEAALEQALEELPAGSLDNLPERMGLPAELQQMLEERFGALAGSLGSAAGSRVRTALQSAMGEIIRSLLPEFIRRALFVLSFLLISLVLKLAVRLLDGVLRNAPIVGKLNRLGGGVVGLAEGLVLVCAAVWALNGLGYFAAPPFSETRALLFLSGLLA